MKIQNCLLFSGILLTLFSCSSQKKLISNYLENVNDTTAPISQLPPSATIQKGDILSIRVYSMSLNPATDVPYNLPEPVAGGATNNGTPAGFLVDHHGHIEYPRLGTLAVAGMTREQLADTIKAQLQDQLTRPSVIVRFLNFKVTVLGEVRTPGTFTLASEKATVLEALGQAGDITEFGRRNTVKILREVDGQRQIGTIDLTTTGMFSSPYYYLQQNDFVFVEQTGRRQQQQEQQNLAQQIGIATSIVTAVALLLNLIR